MERSIIKLEEIFKASPAMLYQFITDPACLVRWFCDEAKVKGNLFHFTWNGYPEVAELTATDEETFIRFKWKDADDEDEFLEFKMFKAGVSNQTVLEVKDFCDSDEIEDSKQLWKNQLTKLRREIGG